MMADQIIIIAVTSFVQSIFGVGVLLFGTPLLLLRGYSFIDAIMVLLPISISINLIQIAKDYRNADWNLYKKILMYAIPFVVMFLFIITRVKINIGIVIGAFLMFVAVKDYSPIAKKGIKYLIRYEKIYFIVMGIIHGLTNLGGSLLTAFVHSKGYEKNVTRVTVALSYATFAIFQILTLMLAEKNFDISFPMIGIYVMVGVTIFLFTEKFVYMDINNTNYSKYFSFFLFISAIVLCIKSLV